MASGPEISRRAMLVGTAVAFAMVVPEVSVAEEREGIPILVQLSWGPDEQRDAPRAKLIAAISDALADTSQPNWTSWLLICG
jgi:hypothetical protein